MVAVINIIYGGREVSPAIPPTATINHAEVWLAARAHNV